MTNTEDNKNKSRKGGGKSKLYVLMKFMQEQHVRDEADKKAKVRTNKINLVKRQQRHVVSWLQDGLGIKTMKMANEKLVFLREEGFLEYSEKDHTYMLPKNWQTEKYFKKVISHPKFKPWMHELDADFIKLVGEDLGSVLDVLFYFKENSKSMLIADLAITSTIYDLSKIDGEAEKLGFKSYPLLVQMFRTAASKHQKMDFEKNIVKHINYEELRTGEKTFLNSLRRLCEEYDRFYVEVPADSEGRSN